MKKMGLTGILALGACLLVSAGAQEPEQEKRPDPKRWESAIAKFEAAEAKNPAPKNAILFVGSSSIRMWKLGESYPDRQAINRGFGGSTLADSIYYFDRVIAPLRPRVIVVYAGDNDIAKGLTAEETFADFKTLAGRISEKLPESKVIYIAIKPSIKRWDLWPVMKATNDVIAAWCETRDGFCFADIARPMLETADGKPDPELFAKDGLHLSKTGYAVWKAVLDPLLEKALGEKIEK